MFVNLMSCDIKGFNWHQMISIFFYMCFVLFHFDIKVPSWDFSLFGSIYETNWIGMQQLNNNICFKLKCFQVVHFWSFSTSSGFGESLECHCFPFQLFKMLTPWHHYSMKIKCPSMFNPQTLLFCGLLFPRQRKAPTLTIRPYEKSWHNASLISLIRDAVHGLLLAFNWQLVWTHSVLPLSEEELCGASVWPPEPWPILFSCLKIGIVGNRARWQLALDKTVGVQGGHWSTVV